MNAMIVRRRIMGNSSGGVSFPIISNYPALVSYGSYRFNVAGVTTNDTVKACIRSGDTVYENLGPLRSTESFEVDISSHLIVLYVNGGTISAGFAGFPIKIKCCNGLEEDPSVTTFTVYKLR